MKKPRVRIMKTTDSIGDVAYSLQRRFWFWYLEVDLYVDETNAFVAAKNLLQRLANKREKPVQVWP